MTSTPEHAPTCPARDGGGGVHDPSVCRFETDVAEATHTVVDSMTEYATSLPPGQTRDATWRAMLAGVRAVATHIGTIAEVAGLGLSPEVAARPPGSRAGAMVLLVDIGARGAYTPAPIGPKSATSPSHGAPCLVCEQPMREGQLTTVLPVSAADDEQGKLAARGEPHRAMAVEVHWSHVVFNPDGWQTLLDRPLGRGPRE